MTQKRKKYGRDFKEKIVLMSYESRNIAKLEKEFGLQRGQLTVWRQKLETSGNGNFPAEHFFKLRNHYGKIQDLEKKIRHMDEKFQILKAAGSFLNKGAHILFSFILENEKTYSIRQMCKVLNVNRSFYQNWKRNLPTKTQMRKKIRQQKIADAFYDAEQRYGACRITAALQQEGLQICLATVKRYMKEMGLKCSTKKMAAAKRRNPSAAVRFSGS
ncbi:MAG: IS3 family transposase [Flavobacterium sp.]|jgi:transposase-like protein/transposase|uniref:IS3 family transposase n=1 Tax=Flavobacterium sp. TaxID=239 RepID=UPI003D09B3D5